MVVLMIREFETFLHNTSLYTLCDFFFLVTFVLILLLHCNYLNYILNSSSDVTVTNSTVFLMSLSMYLLLIFRNTMDFCIFSYIFLSCWTHKKVLSPGSTFFFEYGFSLLFSYFLFFFLIFHFSNNLTCIFWFLYFLSFKIFIQFFFISSIYSWDLFCICWVLLFFHWFQASS